MTPAHFSFFKTFCKINDSMKQRLPFLLKEDIYFLLI